MTDITDQDRRDARKWAEYIAKTSKYDDEITSETHAAVNYILATVDAQPPTIADEIMDLGRALDQYGYFDALGIDVAALADRVAQVEHDITEARARVKRFRDLIVARTAERDEARAEVKVLAEDLAGAESEVERLTAVNENLRRTDNYRECKEFLGVQKGAESNAETTDPADVPAGEPWLVRDGQELSVAVRDAERWVLTYLKDATIRYRRIQGITLVSRLVPAPRVITNPDEIEALPHRTVIRDSAGVMFQRILHGWYQDGDTSVDRADDNSICLPVTVLWEPGS